MRRDSDIRLSLYRVIYLPHLPADYIARGLEDLVIAPLLALHKFWGPIRALIAHYVSYYLDKIGAEAISVFGQRNRTTSPLEASHLKDQKYLTKHGPWWPSYGKCRDI